MSWYPAGACYFIIKFCRAKASTCTYHSFTFALTAYLLEIFPISLVRFLSFNTTHDVGHGWTILASVCFASSGMINMLLWLLTGRKFGFTLPPSESEDDEEQDAGQDRPTRRQSGDLGSSGGASLNGDAYGVRIRRRAPGSAGGDSGEVASADGDIELVMAAAPKSPSLTTATFPMRQHSQHTFDSVAAYDMGHDRLPVSATPIGMAAGVIPSSSNDDILGPPPPPWGPAYVATSVPHARHPSSPPHLRVRHARSLSRSSEGDGSSSSPSPRRSVGGGRSSRSGGYQPDTISMASVTTGTGVGVDNATFTRSLQYPADNNIMGLGLGVGAGSLAAVAASSGGDGVMNNNRSRNSSPIATLSSSGGAGRSSLGPPSPYAPTQDSRTAVITTSDAPRPSPA